ncbi:peptidoglycan D,D-transpeptidase FtsI family protein [Serinicoccus chungangensis]|uniref:peptidoglycan D,D-transpeptidase FtsI family protein n=1 Tax=Serinicoccus chungangensis TaxID=767452 RepID=UPI00128EAC51|nr:penicillin-binding protein 2 [Serinicoccus chungangensis]
MARPRTGHRSPSAPAVAAGVAHPARRARALMLGVLIVLSLFAAQLVRLQGLDAASVSAAALGERLQSRTIPAARGSITDVDGDVLAVSVERRRIVADPTLVVDYTRTEQAPDGSRQVVGTGYAAAAQVVSEITGADQADVLRRLVDPLGEQYAVLVPDASPQEWQEIKAANVRGVSSEELMRREYPLGEAAAPLLGWIGSGEMAAGGIELVKDEELTGEPGEALFEIGQDGQRISTGVYEEDPARPGQDLRLTIDADLQWRAYDAVRTRVKEAGALSGYAAVMDVETGQLRALTSYPGFDPSQSTQDAADMRNAAVEDVYEPGSTSKLITAAAALEEGIVEPDTPIEVPVTMSRAGTRFKDAEPHPIEYLTFGGVLAKSSNMGTILYGEKLSDQQIYDWMRRFGIGDRTGLGLPGESAGLVPEPSTWSATTRYTFMFGQGLSGTLLQQMGVFQTIANDGLRVHPSIIAGTVDEEGRYTEEEPVAAQEDERVISEETAQSLTEIMQQVPSTGGTAPLAAVPGYHVAGKTSTASRIDPETGRYDGSVTSSFMGFAPADDPKYVVAVVIQRPTRISEFGGVVAGPVFADLMRYALQQEGIAPASTPPAEFDIEFDPEEPVPGQKGVTLGDLAIKDERTDG